MSKITNDGLTRSGTGRFIAVPWQQWECQMVKVVPDKFSFLLTVPFLPAPRLTVAGFFCLKSQQRDLPQVDGCFIRREVRCNEPV